MQAPAVLGARLAGRWRGFPSRRPIGTDPVRAAEALIKLEAREARLRGLDMPTKVAVTDPDRGIPLETIRRVMERVDRQRAEVDVTPSKPAQIDVVGDTSPTHIHSRA